MKKRFVTLFSLICIFALMVSFSVGMTASHAMDKPASSLGKNMKIDTVDGKAYSPKIHKKIVAFIIYRNAVNGHHILGFSSIEKYKAYQKQHIRSKAVGTNYFYEHASFDSRGLGAYITLSVGNSYYYVGDSWNDRISSLHIYPSSYVTLYQHWHYQGYYLTLINNGGNYWFQNLTDYNMPNGTNWNDQVSSITSGW